MSELRPYYDRLLSVIQSDLDAMLTNPDPTARPPKAILELLKAGQACEEALKATENSDISDWDKLSAEAQAAILDIISKDLT